MSENMLQQFHVLPANLANHLMITMIPLAIGVSVSLPLAILLVKNPRLRYPALTTVSIIQTIPSLALLALMVPLLAGLSTLVEPLGFRISALGFYPAVIGLTLYSMLPMVRNTVTGIAGVDPTMTEAARGMGMTPRQVLWKVELPLAAPVIIAGIRTATVWVVGIATLSTPVGQRSLGNYIFSGLQTQNWTAVLFGCVAAALLAILLDLLLGGLEMAVKDRRRLFGLVMVIILLLVTGAGIVAPQLVQWVRSSGNGQLRIGGDYEFFSRPEWLAIMREYDLALSGQNLISYDSTFMYQAVDRGEVDVISAFTSDGRIRQYDLVVLEDPKQVIPPYDAVLLMNAETAENEALRQALEPLIGAIPVETMRQANYMVDRDTDHRTVSEAARWLKEQILSSAENQEGRRRQTRIRPGQRNQVVWIGSKTFTEQYILAEVMVDLVEEAGFTAREKQSLGSTVIFDALRTGEIDAYVDYTGTIWANYMDREGTADPDVVLQEVSEWLSAQGIVMLGSLGFENAYGLAMRRDRAEEMGIETIGDLAAYDPE